MATADDMREVRQVLNRKIAELAKVQTSPTSVLRLAEAFAWTNYPNQPHGSSSAPSPS